MIDFDLNDDQLLLRDSLERFVSQTYSPEQRRSYRSEAAGFSAVNWAQLAELGLLGLAAPEEFEGLGGSLIDLALAAETLGKGLVTEPYLQASLAIDLLSQAGGDLAQEWVPAVASGTRHVAVAHDALLGGVGVEAPEGGQHRLSGTIAFVELAGVADAMLVPASGGGESCGVYFVPLPRAGLTRRDYRIVDGSVASEVRLDSVETAPPLRLNMSASLARARVLASAEMLGIMTVLFDATLEFAKTRQQFKQPIGQFQVIQHRLARLYVRLEQSRSLLLKAALTVEGNMFGANAAGAKAYISDAATFLAHECIQFHGGMGITDELAIGHGLKRIMVLARLYGEPTALIDSLLQPEQLADPANTGPDR